MEDCQIRDAQTEYDKMCDGEIVERSNYELLNSLPFDDWCRDAGDYVLPDNKAQFASFLGYLLAATKAEDRGDFEMTNAHYTEIGRQVHRNVLDTLHRLDERGLL